MAEYIYGRLKSSGEIVSIYEIPKNIKLRKGWECVCPKCSIDIIARRGEIKEDHFAHKPAIHGPGSGNGNGCSAGSANETALHQMAKQIIEEERKISIPKKEIPLGNLKRIFPVYIQKKLPEIYPVQPAAVLICEDVRLEERMADFQPDAVVVAQGRTYLIEIKVLHQTPPEKIERVAKYGRYPMLEIDLSSFLDKPISREKLRSLITSETRLREWIYYPNEAELIEQARQFLESLDIVKEYRKSLSEKERREQQERERKERENQRRQAAKERRERKQWQMFQPEYYAALLLKYKGKAGGYTKEVFSKYHFYKEGTLPPFFVNIPITGEIIFRCDRRVWQAAIFDRWIYFRKNDDAAICIFNIFEELARKNIPVEPMLTNGKVSIPDIMDDEFLPYRVVRTYLDYLEALGFIEIRGKWANVVRRMSIMPPNQEYAAALEAAIKRLGEKKSSPNIDDLIYEELEPYRTAKNEKAAALRRELEEEKRAAVQRNREAARAAEQEKDEQDKQNIQTADYDQDDTPIYDRHGVRWMKCSICKRKMPGFKIAKHESLNRGICRACRPIRRK